MYYITKYISPLEEITLASDGGYITGLWFKGQKYFGSVLKNKDFVSEDCDILNQAKNWLNGYFNNKKPKADELPLLLAGSNFQNKIWNVIKEIPYGKTISYKELAQYCNIPVFSQAVGQAVGRNPISIIIPCHRVIGTDGSLKGYAAGINIKQKLLQFEGCIK